MIAAPQASEDEEEEPDGVVSQHMAFEDLDDPARERPAGDVAARARRFVPPAGEQLAPSGQRARAQANPAAPEVLLRLRQEQRAAGPGEQRMLAAWSRWGAVAQLFDEDRENPAPMRERLRELAGEQGHQAARRTTINAHYTAPHVAAAMREAMQALGSDRGRVLEPGCAAGIFLGLAPAGAELVDVEPDPRPRRSRPNSTRTPRCAPNRLRPRPCPTATSTWRSGTCRLPMCGE